MSKEFEVKEFCGLLEKIGTVKVLGLARLLGVDIVDKSEALKEDELPIFDTVEEAEKEKRKKIELPKMRDGEEIVQDLINSFAALSRPDRRRVVKLMRANIKEKK